VPAQAGDAEKQRVTLGHHALAPRRAHHARARAFGELTHGFAGVARAEAGPNHERLGCQQLGTRRNADRVRDRRWRGGHARVRWGFEQGGLQRQRQAEMGDEAVLARKPGDQACERRFELGRVLEYGGVVEQRPGREQRRER
jgi:hypothetical protein